MVGAFRCWCEHTSLGFKISRIVHLCVSGPLLSKYLEIHFNKNNHPSFALYCAVRILISLLLYSNCCCLHPSPTVRESASQPVSESASQRC